MRMRINRQQLHRFRQREFIAHQEIIFAGGNIQRAIVVQLQQNRKFCGRLVREINSDAGLNGFRCARGLQVRVQHQIVSGVESERHPGRLHNRSAARLPKQEMPVGIE